ncbi:MAG TPA: patatin-like phospholipase family protein [Streptosporangiaceae bacterium]|nr:patatin-like phospholipase family protein [Streptosporangiaceae bacterium]
METALVLGGGGVTGIAWEWGMLAGLAEAGIDLSTADLVIGTSAGSVVGAQVAAGLAAKDRYAAQLTAAGGELTARLTGLVWAQIAWAVLRSRIPQRARARIGRMALAAKTVPEAERRAVIEARLPVRTWPDRKLLITAVDALSGEFVTFDKDSGVSLVDAVAASCAVPGVWPPVTINDRRYIDGGVRSAANADLATGYARVVVLAPITSGFGPLPSVARQVSQLPEGARVIVLSPDKAARKAIGRNMLDPARRAAAAKAGHAQAATVTESVAAVWPSPR